MKKIIIFIVFIILMSCNKNEKSQDNNIVYNTVIENIDNENFIYLNKKMYVNATSGLRVRNIPSMEGERIGLLDNYTEVNIIMEDNNIVIINNTEGKWVYINRPIEGWVFNGYLINEITIDSSIILGLWQVGTSEYPYLYVFSSDGNTWARGGYGAEWDFGGTWRINRNILSLRERPTGHGVKTDENGNNIEEYKNIDINLNIIDNNNIELIFSNNEVVKLMKSKLWD